MSQPCFASPVVSVCVQTYQHVNFIGECLDSILNQETDFPYEILVGEDDSADGTRAICIDYAERHPDRIRLFLHDRKDNISIQGRPTGRYNLLNNFRESKGKYVAFCEGDDFWTDPTKLQQQYDFLQSNDEYVLCYHNVRLAQPDGTLMDKWKLSPSQIGKGDPDSFVTRIQVPLLAAMWRREAMPARDFPKEFYTVFNGDTLILATLANSGPGAYLPTIADAVARIHDGGVWSSQSSTDKTRNLIDTSQRILAVVEPRFHDEIIRRIERGYHQLLSECLKRFQLKSYLQSLQELRKFLNEHHRPLFRSLALHQARFLRGLLRSKNH